MLEVRLDALDQVFVAVEAGGGDGSVDGLAVVAIVEIRHVGGDKLALAGSEAVRAVEQGLDQIVEGPGSFRAEGHCTADAGQPIGQRDVRHEYSFQGIGDSVAVAAATESGLPGEKRRCSKPPASTTATPIRAGKGLCMRMSSATMALPVR